LRITDIRITNFRAIREFRIENVPDLLWVSIPQEARKGGV